MAPSFLTLRDDEVCRPLRLVAPALGFRDDVGCRPLMVSVTSAFYRCSIATG